MTQTGILKIVKAERSETKYSSVAQKLDYPAQQEAEYLAVCTIRLQQELHILTTAHTGPLLTATNLLLITALQHKVLYRGRRETIL